MSKHVTSYRVALGATHEPTGRTTHNILRGGKMGKPTSLEIAHYPGTPGFYLFYFDADGDELSDTYHDSVAQAMHQAKWEFGIEEDEWEHI